MPKFVVALFAPILASLKRLHEDYLASEVKRLRMKEIVNVMRVAHAQELNELPHEQWSMKIQEQKQRIAAVEAGNLDAMIVDRRSWSYPYLPECTSENSEILTKRGWIAVADATADDEFATLSRQGYFEWQKPIKLVRYRYQGDMLRFKNKMLDIEVTPEHRMLGRFHRGGYIIRKINARKERREYQDLDYLRWSKETEPHKTKAGVIFRERSNLVFCTAKNVESFYKRQKGVRYDCDFRAPCDAKWKGSFPSNYNPKTGKILLACEHESTGKHWSRNREPVWVDLKDWVAFLGIFIAEGHAGGTGLGKRRDKRRPYYVQAIAAAADIEFINRKQDNYNIEISQMRSSRHYRNIQALLARLPWNFEPTKNAFRVSNATLHSNLFTCGNTYTKRVPEWVKELPTEYLDIFLEWACKGDGWKQGAVGKENRNYKTVSAGLADDVQEMFLKVGRDIRVDYVPRSNRFGKGKFLSAPQYVVKERWKSEKRLPRPTRFAYDGFVYCVSVPNSTICVRRTSGGLAVWTGNSLHRLRCSTSRF